MSNYEQYEHHGKNVFVHADLKGRHREHCLCYDCDLFKPGTPQNCHIAQSLYDFDKEHGVTTPVWECPVFIEAQ